MQFALIWRWRIEQRNLGATAQILGFLAGEGSKRLSSAHSYQSGLARPQLDENVLTPCRLTSM